MPLALEHFDLRSYDLVISSEIRSRQGRAGSIPARGIICYWHTPMRYCDLYPAYLHE